jgi:hypothetical protein
VFGSETVVDPAPLGTPIAFPGTARYVSIRLMLDDTGTSNVDQSTYVSDITIGQGPNAGVVSDGLGADIDSQMSTSTIEANWSGFTASGDDAIASYEWAIGTAPGLTNVQSWVNVGLATTATNSTLFLGVGTTYYVRVRAISTAGLPSLSASSDGVQVVAAPTAGGGGNDSKHGHCGHAASTSPGPIVLLLAGLAVLASAFRARLKGRLTSLGYP